MTSVNFLKLWLDMVDNMRMWNMHWQVCLCVLQCVQPDPASVWSPDGVSAAVPRARAVLVRLQAVGANHQRPWAAGCLWLLPGNHRPDWWTHEGGQHVFFKVLDTFTLHKVKLVSVYALPDWLCLVRRCIVLWLYVSAFQAQYFHLQLFCACWVTVYPDPSTFTWSSSFFKVFAWLECTISPSGEHLTSS